MKDYNANEILQLVVYWVPVNGPRSQQPEFETRLMSGFNNCDNTLIDRYIHIRWTEVHLKLKEIGNLRATRKNTTNIIFSRNQDQSIKQANKP